MRSRLLTGDRSDNFFTPEKYPFGIFIEPKAVAVIVDNKWKFCKPGTPYLPYGGLPWYEEQISSMMLASNGGYVWHTIPASPPDASPVKRTGRFKLLRDGNLEGSVTIAYEGHPAAWRRAEGYLSSPGQRETKVIEEATQNLKTAEIRSVAIENFDDPQKPLVYSYAVGFPDMRKRPESGCFFSRDFLKPVHSRFFQPQRGPIRSISHTPGRSLTTSRSNCRGDSAQEKIQPRPMSAILPTWVRSR